MKKKLLKVGVLMGGPSTEREVSMITGQAVFDNLDRKKYSVSKIIMGRDSTFVLKQKNGRSRKLDFLNKDRKLFDLIFIAMHGTPGEDGTVQGLFQFLGIKYTGPEALSSALAMNKVYSAMVYYANGLPHPEFIHFKKEGWKHRKEKILSDIKVRVGFPLVLKPVDQGSAVGVTIVKQEKELEKEINKTIKQFSWLMAQKFIKGQEGTCGVIEKDDQLMPLPPTHILANLSEFYDYKSKYSKGGSTHVCPADFPEEINHQMQDLALAAHQVLGCRGMSRTDIFYCEKKKEKKYDHCEHGENGCGHDHCGCEQGELYVIETNTIPGMTPTSLFPEAVGKVGIGFSEMLDLIIKASL